MNQKSQFFAKICAKFYKVDPSKYQICASLVQIVGNLINIDPSKYLIFDRDLQIYLTAWFCYSCPVPMFAAHPYNHFCTEYPPPLRVTFTTASTPLEYLRPANQNAYACFMIPLAMHKCTVVSCKCYSVKPMQKLRKDYPSNLIVLRMAKVHPQTNYLVDTDHYADILKKTSHFGRSQRAKLSHLQCIFNHWNQRTGECLISSSGYLQVVQTYKQLSLKK